MSHKWGTPRGPPEGWVPFGGGITNIEMHFLHSYEIPHWLAPRSNPNTKDYYAIFFPLVVCELLELWSKCMRASTSARPLGRDDRPMTFPDYLAEVVKPACEGL